jgi:hypothetical protein
VCKLSAELALLHSLFWLEYCMKIPYPAAEVRYICSIRLPEDYPRNAVLFPFSALELGFEKFYRRKLSAKMSFRFHHAKFFVCVKHS